jgi:hypothetical protein
MVERIDIAYDASWKSRRRSWIRKAEEVEQYLPKTSEMMYLLQIASQKCGNVIGPHNLLLR